MIAIRKAEMPARPATAIAIGASSAAVAMLPGPSEARADAEDEEHHRDQAGVAAAARDALCASLSSVPFELRLREQQRHAGQRQEQLDREAGGDFVEAACRRGRRR